MLTLTVQPKRLWDEKENRFRMSHEHPTTISLEHSLISISKWESKWHKAFLTDRKKTPEEMFDYVKCMTITKNVPEGVFYALAEADYTAISEYIENPMSASNIHSGAVKSKKKSRDVMTSDLIYYYMVAGQIDWQAQTWHLNRLLKLIEIYALKQEESNRESKKGRAKSPSVHKPHKH